MKKAIRFPFLSDILIFLTGIALLGKPLKEIANDPGTGWHLATGNWVISQIAVPFRDPFLADQQPWVADQWLSEVVFAYIFRIGSWQALAGFTFILFMSTFFILLRKGFQAPPKSSLLLLIASLSACKVAQIHFLLRPVIFSFLFFTATYVLLVRFQVKKKSLCKKGLAGWSILFVLWANTHPFFILGLVLIALWPLGILINAVIHKQDSNQLKKDLFPPAMIFMVCCLSTLVNPYLWNLHLSIANLGGSTFFMNYHMEWNSPNFDNLEGKLAEAITLCIVVSYFLQQQKINSFAVFQFLALVVFGHGSLQAVRVLPFYMIIATLPFVTCMQQLGALFKNFPVLRLLPELETIEEKSTQGYLGTGLCIAMGLLIAFSGGIKNGENDFSPTPAKFPILLIQTIDAPDNTVLTAPARWGGIISFYSDGNIKPVLDDRNTLVGEKLYKQFHRAEKNIEKMVQLMKEKQSNLLLLPHQHFLECHLENDSRFTIEKTDTVAKLYKLETSLSD